MKKLIAIDRPRAGVPVRSYDGWLEVSGWAAAGEPVRDIRVRFGDGAWARAVHCQPRPDVLAAYPKLPGAARSGFQAFVETAGDRSELEVVVTCGSKGTTYGQTARISSEVREIEVADTTAAPCAWCGAEGRRLDEAVARGPFRLVTCPRCDFGLAEPLPAAHALGAIYETEYWDHAPLGPDVLSPSADTELVCGFLDRFGNGGRRVLEVGCGQGTLLFGLHQRGLDVRGQDLSSNSARALEQSRGVRIWRQPITSIATDERFDCILTRHVIEHSITPRLDFDWMRDHLAPGGILVLWTPNRRSLAAEILGSTWEWFVPPIHVGYFSSRSLRCIADVAGLRLRHLTTREGDGAPLLPSLRAFMDYEGELLPEWQRRRCLDLVSGAGGGFESMMAAGGAAAGLGQELIAVLTAI
ncbi:MAG: class I SAM-dependent methyltransferase [Planctomycetes bacterium]|nr:class I SAM-dependent methyltransferase [Planctomycetota bacterium]